MARRPSSRLWLLWLPLLAVLLLAPPQARAAQVRAADHGTYGRLVFDWPQPTSGSVDVVAGQVVIRFAEPVRDDPGKVAAPLRAYLSAVRLSDDRRTVTLALRGPFQVNRFALGNALVLDLLKESAPEAQGQTPGSAPAPASAPATTKPAPRGSPAALAVRVGEHPGYSRLVFDWPKAVKYTVNTAGNRAVVVFDDAAQVDVAAVRAALPEPLKAFSAETAGGKLTVTLPLPPGGRVRHFTTGPKVAVDVLSGEPETAETAGPQPPAAAAALAAAEAAPPTASPSPPTPTPTPAPAPAPAVATEAPATPPPPAAEPVVSARVASLSFPWDQPTAAAVFFRGGYLWVVFDRPKEMDLRLLRRTGGEVVSHVEQRKSAQATVIRLLVATGYAPSLRREGHLWVVDLQRQPYRPDRPIDVQPQPRSPVGARLFIPVAEAGKPLVLEDPEIGDRFIVVPVIPLGNGVFPARGFPDADLPVTAQGVVVEPRSDKVVVNAARNGVDVTAQGGLVLSSDPAATAATAGLGSATDLTKAFDIPAWQRGPESDLETIRKTLQEAVAGSPAARRNPARLDLARFYFAHGLAAEALGVLRVIADSAPEMANTAAFRALRGAASFMMGRDQEAVDDLGHPVLAGNDEAQFWRAAAQARLGQPELQARTLRDLGAVIDDYPRRLRMELALTAAAATVAAADDLGTQAFLAAARSAAETTRDKAAITYLEGRLAQAGGDFEKAADLWGELAESTDRYYRARATRDRLELLFRTEQLSRADLIKGLERLRFAWRGGAFELDVLMRLGDLLGEDKAYGKALRVWQQAATYFKGQEGADIAAARMRDTFDALFHDGAADTLPPVTAIALFDEFRELTPTGEKGDEMIRRLADRLVAVDLLEQAAMLLDRQIQYRLTGAEKARVGARLGLVYLLDRKPAEAVRALLASRDPDAPENLEVLRRQLTARALADLGNAEEAVAMLDGDDSRNAQLLRAEITWRSGQWAAAAAALGSLVPAASTTLVLTDDESRMILDWVTALTLGQDETAVAEARRRYGEAMARTPFKDAFDLITNPPEKGLIDYRTVGERIKQAEDFRSFLSAYRERLSTAGLSAIN